MRLDFTGRTVVVTGATRGIGRRLAEDFAAAGADLVLTGTSADEVEQLQARAGEGERWHRVDFTEPASVDAFAAALEAMPRIDACVNNAGINRINPIDETVLDDWDALLAVNLTGPFRVLRSVSAVMKRAGYGRIVNMGSIFGSVSREKRSVYSTTKFGLRGLTVGASNDLARFGVLVNTVSPGFVLTDLTRRILSEEERAQLAGQVPAGRLAETSDISPVVLFLCSALNTYITGQDVVVDGGFLNV
jgi:NAD(P)-dependent dehydrogenase (short-subunit alcohol dehydrogenase family)